MQKADTETNPYRLFDRPLEPEAEVLDFFIQTADYSCLSRVSCIFIVIPDADCLAS